jgi:transglutaminase-like putative cysteine protease
MRRLVRQYKKDATIRNTAASMIQRLDQKDWESEITTLFHFVRDSIRYMRDVRGVETVQTPVATLSRGYGDCDDKSTLLASLLESVGHPTRFVAIGRGPNSFSHVYVETRIGTRWIGLEPTEPVPAGWKPPRALFPSRIVVHN